MVGRVRVTRWAWQRPRKPTVRPLAAAIDLPREVYSSGVRRFVCEQLADRSVGRCTEALSNLGIEVTRATWQTASGDKGGVTERETEGVAS